MIFALLDPNVYFNGDDKTDSVSKPILISEPILIPEPIPIPKPFLIPEPIPEPINSGTSSSSSYHHYLGTNSGADPVIDS